ncbi:YebC/PmpR family DNA-binding transcriptional regulator [Patescibacteria group bacterium]|nr:YebC/PmpR family DNA-binding transcriptional regulator [Patescibacteria group bacterium]MBU2036367.1 YebC/PmpR family DNA-binding transcriptional regulator [Patescibacteria group bacterium]
MSGHSHYSTIKRQKESNDAKKGRVFSKMAREIAIAVKAGGSDPDSNYKLRIIIDKARSYNMPKSNIDRAISSGIGGEVLEEITYEGFGPGGIGIIVKVATDNKNRTAQGMKNIFERVGGSLAGPGAVSFNFENKGFILVEKNVNSEEQILKLIDLGIEDIEEITDGIEVYVSPDKLSETRKKIEELRFTIKETELFMKPITYQRLEGNDVIKAIDFLDLLDDQDDVQSVYSNLDIPSEQ